MEPTESREHADGVASVLDAFMLAAFCSLLGVLGVLAGVLGL